MSSKMISSGNSLGGSELIGREEKNFKTMKQCILLNTAEVNTCHYTHVNIYRMHKTKKNNVPAWVPFMVKMYHILCGMLILGEVLPGWGTFSSVLL